MFVYVFGLYSRSTFEIKRDTREASLIFSAKQHTNSNMLVASPLGCVGLAFLARSLKKEIAV